MEFNLENFEAQIADAVKILREQGVSPTCFVVVPSLHSTIMKSIEVRDGTTLPLGATLSIEGVPCVIHEVTQH
jgi:hypothetical protein